MLTPLGISLILIPQTGVGCYNGAWGRYRHLPEIDVYEAVYAGDLTGPGGTQ